MSEKAKQKVWVVKFTDEGEGSTTVCCVCSTKYKAMQAMLDFGEDACADLSDVGEAEVVQPDGSPRVEVRWLSGDVAYTYEACELEVDAP